MVIVIPTIRFWNNMMVMQIILITTDYAKIKFHLKLQSTIISVRAAKRLIS